VPGLRVVYLIREGAEERDREGDGDEHDGKLPCAQVFVLVRRQVAVAASAVLPTAKE
jgi:hypothetical protein